MTNPPTDQRDTRDANAAKNEYKIYIEYVSRQILS